MLQPLFVFLSNFFHGIANFFDNYIEDENYFYDLFSDREPFPSDSLREHQIREIMKVVITSGHSGDTILTNLIAMSRSICTLSSCLNTAINNNTLKSSPERYYQIAVAHSLGEHLQSIVDMLLRFDFITSAKFHVSSANPADVD